MLTLALALAFAMTTPPGDEAEWHTIEVEGRGRLDYALLTPDGFEPDVAAPVLLALPPGNGGRDMVQRGLELYFAEQARRRGWVVVSPAAPEGAPFFSEGALFLPSLLDQLAGKLTVEGGRVHLAGVSSGGRGAFHVAGLAPQRFASLTVLPGVPSENASSAQLAAAGSLPIAFFVGEHDQGWLEASREATQRLHALGSERVSLKVRPGEEHVLDSKLAAEIFDRLDALRETERVRDRTRVQIAKVLDDLHEAASVADEDRYFDQFLPDAIFIGTDASERWTVGQLRAYAAAPFETESAWTYEPLDRHITLAPDGLTAHFYERLMNAKYGETRGSGVLRQRAGRWRIAQYVLSFSVPNEAAPAVVQAIQQGEG